jgi:hypothetical protein
MKCTLVCVNSTTDDFVSDVTVGRWFLLKSPAAARALFKQCIISEPSMQYGSQRFIAVLQTRRAGVKKK